MKNENESKQRKVIDYFIENPTQTIGEISIATGISKSSCQRYLNMPEYMNIRIPSTGNTISEQLTLNKTIGNQRGGRTTFLTHTIAKDASGKFIGTTRDEIVEDKEARKQEDIIKIVRYFSQNPYVTLDDMATFFDRIYTPSYIYDCLNDSRVEELFGKLIASAVKQQLSNNRYGIRKKFGDSWGQQLFEEAGLTEREIAVLNYRFSDEGIHSAEETAYIFEVSKTTITNLEDSALKKLEDYQRDVKTK